MPQISVIVPIYNVECYLPKCIESILSQTYVDFELILIDDGSTDNCGKICDEYAEKDNRIIVIHKMNGGVSSARNAGIDVAQGDYISFIDSDDYIKPDFFETLYNHILSGGFDCAASGYAMTNSSYEVTYEMCFTPHIISFDSPKVRLEYILFKVLQGKTGWESCTRLFKTSIIKQYKIRMCETCENFAEDLGFFLNYLAFCNSVISIDYVGYYYYQRNESMMHLQKKNIKSNALNELSKYVRSFYKGAGVSKEICDHFSVIHHMLFLNEYKRLHLSILNIPPRELRKIVLDRMIDVEYFQKMYKSFFKDTLNPIKSKTKNDEELLNRLKYISDGHYRLYRIRRKLIRVKYRVKKWKKAMF